MNLVRNEYNSGKFDIAMSDVVGLTGLEEKGDVFNLLSQSAGDVDHISVKIPTGQKSCLNSFLRSGFRLVDTQVEFVHSLDQVPHVMIPAGCLVRSFEPQDVTSLEAIARVSFDIDRWHSDESLPDGSCDEYYAEWVKSCVNGYADEILVAVVDGVIAGFMTLRILGGTSGRIDLTAVKESFRGKGIYRALVESALVWAHNRGLTEMLATTQINNYGSQTTWTSERFKGRASWYVLHYSFALDGGCHEKR